MSTSEEPLGGESGSASGSGAPVERSALSFTLAAVPFFLVVLYRNGLVGTLLRLAPLMIIGGAYLLLPKAVQRRPWALWALICGGIGGGLIAHIVLEISGGG